MLEIRHGHKGKDRGPIVAIIWSKNKGLFLSSNEFFKAFVLFFSQNERFTSFIGPHAL